MTTNALDTRFPRKDSLLPVGDELWDALVNSLATSAGVESSDVTQLPLSLSDYASATSPHTLLDLLESISTVESQLEALRLLTLTKLDEAIRAVETAPQSLGATAPTAQGDDSCARTSAHEAGFAGRRSPAASRRHIMSAKRLLRHMPRTFSALADGQISPAQAHAASRAAAPLAAEDRMTVDAELHSHLDRLCTASPRQWDNEVEAACYLHCAHTMERRHAAAARQRHVTMSTRPHGMMRLSMDLPAVEAVAIYTRFSREAERLISEGSSPQGHHLLVVDAMVDALLGRTKDHEPLRLDVGIVVDSRHLTGEPLHGLARLENGQALPLGHVLTLITEGRPPDRYAPSPAPEIDAFYRRILCHPGSGELLAMESRSRRFTPGLKKMIRLRDQYCCTPYCGAPIRHIDHVMPAARGGETSLTNGQGLCASCNLRKEEFATVEVAHESQLAASAAPSDQPGSPSDGPSSPSDAPGSPSDGPGFAQPPRHIAIWRSRWGTTRSSHAPPIAAS